MDSHTWGDPKVILKNLSNIEKDDFGVTTNAVYFNESKNVIYCICDGPDEDSVKKHHDYVGIHCDFVLPVEQLTNHNQKKKREIFHNWPVFIHACT